MAASLVVKSLASVRNVFLRVCHNKMRHSRLHGRICLSIGSGISFYASVGMTLNATDQKMRFPDPMSLSHAAIIRNACGLSIDSATALLSQTTAALMQLHQQYIETMEHLIELLEMQGRLHAANPENNQLWEDIIAARAEVLQFRKDKEALDMIFHSAEKTLAAAAETAFLAGAEAYSLMGSERIQSANQHLRPSQSQLEHISQELRVVEAKLIKAAEKRQTKESEKGPDDGVDFGKLLEEEMKNLTENTETHYDHGEERES